MEKEFDVKPVGVKYICDACKNGEMKPIGKMKTYENHAGFVHECDSCKTEMELRDRYPLIRYEFI